MDEILTKRPISHVEAREVAQRLINSHFRNEPHARIGIPRRPDYDDDLLIMAYIRQREAVDDVMLKEAAKLGVVLNGSQEQ